MNTSKTIMVDDEKVMNEHLVNDMEFMTKLLQQSLHRDDLIVVSMKLNHVMIGKESIPILMIQALTNDGNTLGVEFSRLHSSDIQVRLNRHLNIVRELIEEFGPEHDNDPYFVSLFYLDFKTSRDDNPMTTITSNVRINEQLIIEDLGFCIFLHSHYRDLDSGIGLMIDRLNQMYGIDVPKSFPNIQRDKKIKTENCI